jgi:peptidoglycan/xylan/chitin deacetylase (PgdA/CDA1 family)
VNQKTIYLTFDDGPTPKVTPWVLALLNKYQFNATFFCLGKQALQYPELIEDIKKAGHGIGNHGLEHLKGWTTGNKVYIENTRKGANILNTNLFRPPYGKISPIQWLILRKQFHIVFWNYLSKDYIPQEKNKHFLKKLIRNTKSGRIIVFHDSEKAFPILQTYLEDYFFWLKTNQFHTSLFSL